MKTDEAKRLRREPKRLKRVEEDSDEELMRGLWVTHEKLVRG